MDELKRIIEFYLSPSSYLVGCVILKQKVLLSMYEYEYELLLNIYK